MERKLGNGQPKSQNRDRRLKSFLVIGMLVINPVLLNTYAVTKSLPVEKENPTELVNNYVIESPQQQNNNFKHPTSLHIIPENIVYQRDFKAEGKNWTMYYVDPFKEVREDKFVSYIYFVPEDYKPVGAINLESTSPPELRILVYHDIGENEFIGAIVFETREESGDLKYVTRELKLPDEVANELTHLMLGKTDMKCSKKFAKSFSTVNTADLEPTEIRLK